MNHEALAREMRELREQVPGITDTAVAAADGMLIAADTADTIEPESLAAIAAAGLGIARRATAVTGRGAFRQTVTYGSQGLAAFYAVGDTALMIVLGDEGIDLERLHEHTRRLSAASDRSSPGRPRSAPRTSRRTRRVRRSRDRDRDRRGMTTWPASE